MTLVGTLNGFLKQFQYAEPRFSFVLLGIFASVGLARSASAWRSGPAGSTCCGWCQRWGFE
jgi:hypothetical protein